MLQQRVREFTKERKISIVYQKLAWVAELADAQDSKSCEGNLMRVQVSPQALFEESLRYLKNEEC